MKMITAIIKPFKLDEGARRCRTSACITVTEVKGFGRQKAIPSCTVAPSMWWTFCPKAKVEAAVDDASGARHRGHRGRAHRQDRRRQDFVADLEQVVRIRTGETGVAPL